MVRGPLRVLAHVPGASFGGGFAAEVSSAVGAGRVPRMREFAF